MHQPQQASQQWGRQVSRGTSVGLLGVASLISFGDYETHCLCGSSGLQVFTCLCVPECDPVFCMTEVSTTPNIANRISGSQR